MGTNVVRKRETASEEAADGSGRYFYLVIAGVFVMGFGFNVWSKFAAEGPSQNTFLDLLMIRKTSYCTSDGVLLATPIGHEETPNCIDYRGYRIIEGDSVVIYEIASHDPGSQRPHYARVAELDTHALKRLFNLKFEDRPSNPPKGPLW
jgi:hypothetical protein